MRGKKSDLANKRFGKLVALEDIGIRKRKYVTWLCQCDCGKLTLVRSSHLVAGATKSCGCLQVEKSSKHGEWGKRLYWTWRNMKQRCGNPNNGDYVNYGGKGITICSEWNDYIPFRDWARAHGYKKNLTIDRINSNGDYEPTNCQWLPNEENVRRRWLA